jgi:hypothetical protein
MADKPDCHRDNLGLHESQLAALTGFTGRAVRALAHLREAWVGADDDNADAVEASIRALVQGHSLADNETHRRICRDVLRATLADGQAAELLRRVGLPAKAEGR